MVAVKYRAYEAPSDNLHEKRLCSRCADLPSSHFCIGCRQTLRYDDRRLKFLSSVPATYDAGATLPTPAPFLKLSDSNIFGVAPFAFFSVPTVELESHITSSHCRAALHAAFLEYE